MEATVATNVNEVKNTTVKISIYNGNVKVKHSYSTNQFCSNEAKDFVYNTLDKIITNQNKLKKLGLKNNFFGLSQFKNNIIEIDLIENFESKTIASGIEFKVSQLSKIENEVDKKEAFDIIFETQFSNIQNDILIE
jgi:uncharacterized protein YlaN (UPF0358 family)